MSWRATPPIAAMDRAHAALDAALRTAVAPALALHAEARHAWRAVDHALSELRRVSPEAAPITLRRDGCGDRSPSLGFVDALRAYLAAREG
jgi:hypothetical protein